MLFNSKDYSKENEFNKIAALLIHAAKIDQDFSEKEENIIKKTILEIGANKEDIEKIINQGKEMENNLFKQRGRYI